MKKLERLGTGLSLLCAVHCAATPFLLAALPVLGHRLAESHWIEGMLVGTAAVIGYSTLGVGLRRHGRLMPLVLLTLGLALIGMGHLVLPHEAETAAAVLGGLTLATAQLLNRRSVGGCSEHNQRPCHAVRARVISGGVSQEQ